MAGKHNIVSVLVPSGFFEMSSSEEMQYIVVVNHEEQYSIWPAYKELPLGWRDVGKSGTKEECLAEIEVLWTDMRPLSLRQRMAAGTPPEQQPPTS